MRRSLALVSLLSAFILGGLLVAADDKKEPPVKGQLPAKWKELGLTDVQKKEIYTIQTEYRTKIDDLESQVKKLKDDEHDKLIKVLTEDQKKRLKEIKDPIPDKSSSSGSGSSSGSASTSKASN
jgi:hypothetical protein